MEKQAMTKNFVSLGYSTGDNRGIFYDFTERQFYKARVSDKKDFNLRMAFGFVFLAPASLAYMVLLDLITRAFIIEPTSLLAFAILFASMLISTMAAWGITRRSITVTRNNTYVLYIRDADELKEMVDTLSNNQRKMRNYILLIVTLAIIAFLVCSMVYIFFINFFAIFFSPFVWLILVLLALNLSPYKRKRFYRKYESGELFLENEEQEQND